LDFNEKAKPLIYKDVKKPLLRLMLHKFYKHLYKSIEYCIIGGKKMMYKINKNVKTTLVIGIIGLFIGVAVTPAINSVKLSNVALMADSTITSNDENTNILPTTKSDSNYYAILAGTGRSAGLPVSEFKLKSLYRALISAPNWKEGNIILLIEEDATLANIRNAFETMANKVSPNDVFLFSWQGHGSAIPETQTQGEVWSRFDELDLKDEIIVPVDCYMDLKGDIHNYITDDELGYRFSRINAKGMYLIFESCLSGGLVGISSFDGNGDGVIDENEADNFSVDFKNDFEPNTDDVNGWKRVVVVSTLPDTLGRSTFITGFPMTVSIAASLRGGGIIGKALNLGGEPDKDKNGIITAEESFRWAKPVAFAQFPLIWMGFWGYCFLIFYFSSVDSGDPDPIGSAINATKMLIFEFCYVQIVARLANGYFALNWPHMIDGSPLMDLPIIEIDSSQQNDLVVVPYLPDIIWDKIPYEELSEETQQTITKEQYDQASWDKIDQQYWPQLIVNAKDVSKEGQTIKFEGTAYNGPDPYKFEWSFGDGTTSNEKNPSHTYDTKGKYQVTLTVTDSERRIQSKTITAQTETKSNLFINFLKKFTEIIPILKPII
jgi:hypothetical protein